MKTQQVTNSVELAEKPVERREHRAPEQDKQVEGVAARLLDNIVAGANAYKCLQSNPIDSLCQVFF